MSGPFTNAFVNGLRFWDQKLPEYPTMNQLSQPYHPFYPPSSTIPVYSRNHREVMELLTTFALGVSAILAITWFALGKTNIELRTRDKATVLWFTLSGTIHLFFEGYFVYNHATLGSKHDLFGELWKEYALSDSRYLTSDSFTLCMECITAVFWGPLCYYVAYCVATSHPLRFPLQLIVSIGQIYGDILYYATSMFDYLFRGVQFFRPEPFYFWGYYVLMNAFWILFPGILVWQSVTRTRQAFAALSKLGDTVDKYGRLIKPAANGHAANGHVKK